jgi:hypothetical protein
VVTGYRTPAQRHRHYEHRLRSRVKREQGCLGSLPQTTQDLLGLRAGLDGPPLSRSDAAAELGLTRAGARQLEHAGLRELHVSCGGGSAPAGGGTSQGGAAQLRLVSLAEGAPELQPATSLASSTHGSEGSDRRGSGDVKGVTATSPRGARPPLSATANSSALDNGSVGRGLPLLVAAVLAMMAAFALVALRRRAAAHQRGTRSTATASPAASVAPTATASPAASVAPTATATAIATATPAAIAAGTATATPTATAAGTATTTAPATPAPAPAATPAPAPAPAATPAATPAPGATAAPAPTAAAPSAVAASATAPASPGFSPAIATTQPAPRSTDTASRAESAARRQQPTADSPVSGAGKTAVRTRPPASPSKARDRIVRSASTVAVGAVSFAVRELRRRRGGRRRR